MPASLADLYHLMSNASFAGTSTCEQSQFGTSFQHAIYSSEPKLYSDSNNKSRCECPPLTLTLTVTRSLSLQPVPLSLQLSLSLQLYS